MFKKEKVVTVAVVLSVGVGSEYGSLGSNGSLGKSEDSFVGFVGVVSFEVDTFVEKFVGLVDELASGFPE